MLLSYNRLIELIENGAINAPFSNVNGASIDITFGDEILYENKPDKNHIRCVDLALGESIIYDRCNMGKEGIVLSPGEFILATSVETFNLPNNIAAEYKLKSSIARNGLEHLMAGWCDPGWSNSKLTLELKNVTEYHSLVIAPGMKIGQIVFWECEEVPVDFSYQSKGRYNNQRTVVGSKGVI